MAHGEKTSVTRNEGVMRIEGMMTGGQGLG